MGINYVSLGPADRMNDTLGANGDRVKVIIEGQNGNIQGVRCHTVKNSRLSIIEHSDAPDEHLSKSRY
jgi:hypothetical protein